jgi:hypothetical protein
VASVVQTKVTVNANAFSGDATEALTFDAPATVGNYIVAAFWVTASSRDISTVTDNGSGGTNTYAILSQGGVDANRINGTEQVEVWIVGALVERVASIVTVVLNGAVGSPGRMAIWEVTGQHATPVEDVATQDNGGTGDQSHDTGPVVTAAAASLLFAVLAGGSGTYTNPGGWTELDNQANGLIAYRSVDAASTTWIPTSAANEQTVSAVVAIQPAAGGGGSSPHRRPSTRRLMGLI